MLWFLLILGIGAALAQKKPLLTDPFTVEQAVKEELAELEASESWQEYFQDNNIKGSYTFQITVWNKGEVVSVLAVERSKDGTIPNQNSIKNYIKLLKFGFKVPKGKRYTVDHTFITK